MEKILSSGLINISELAARLWPDRTRKNASNLLRMKINKQNGNSLSLSDAGRITEIISKHSADIWISATNEWSNA